MIDKGCAITAVLFNNVPPVYVCEISARISIIFAHPVLPGALLLDHRRQIGHDGHREYRSCP
jgi:hypothetical protein